MYASLGTFCVPFFCGAMNVYYNETCLAGCTSLAGSCVHV